MAYLVSEWCSCGGGIKTNSIELHSQWRASHNHTTEPSEEVRDIAGTQLQIGFVADYSIGDTQ